MKIIINAASIYKGGAEQVVNSFINECTNIPKHDYYILLCDNIYNSLDVELLDSNFHFYRLKKRPASNIYHLFKTRRYFDRLEKKIEPDAVISTGGHGYWIPKAPLVLGFNMAHYIYSKSPYFKKISFKRRLYWELKKKFDLFFYNKADAIITQTDDVNQRVKKITKDKAVYTVSNTVNGAFANPLFNGQKLPPKKDEELRLLTVSSNYLHKNLTIITDVVDRLIDEGVENVRFILTLPEDIFIEGFKGSRYKKYILNVGPVPIDECPSLYRECDIMFLPTLLECFSASYAEAMVMEKPIMTSDLPFAKTVCKDAAVFFDPLNPDEIAAKIKWLMQSPETQKELVQRGNNIFDDINTPGERAERFLSICENLQSKN